MDCKIKIITIDGPTCSGKGTIGRLLAMELGWHFLDSGILYRIIALQVIEKGVNPDDEGSVIAVAKQSRDMISLMDSWRDGHQEVCVYGKDVTKAIRQERCGGIASKIAVIAEIREIVVEICRKFARPPGLIADGRDMGSIVFPMADLKIFLTASVDIRARRRLDQLKSNDINVSLDEILVAMQERDKRDSNRSESPLKLSEEFWVIDTTNHRGVSESFLVILRKIREVCMV